MDTYRQTYILLWWTLIYMNTFAEKTVRIEENESSILECPAKNIISITNASYNGKALFCPSNDVTGKVRRKCQDRQTCTLDATDNTYKDTCRGPNELLLIKYECHEDCAHLINGKTFYNGTRKHTESGRLCQWWDDNEPHKPMYRPNSGGQRNYCRNPDGDKQLWCYTVDPEKRWEHCDIELCDTAFVTTTMSLEPFGAGDESDDEDDEDTPVAIILGVLFGVLAISIVLVVVFITLKRRGILYSEPPPKEQRKTYIYSAPENGQTLLGRVRRLVQRNSKRSDEGGALANNPGYSAMQGERIEAVDYSNDVILKTRVYEMPNACSSGDAHNQMYTSLYDTPTIDRTEDNLDNSFENQYEEPQAIEKPSKPIVAIKPMIRNPKPSPKSSPNPELSHKLLPETELSQKSSLKPKPSPRKPPKPCGSEQDDQSNQRNNINAHDSTFHNTNEIQNSIVTSKGQDDSVPSLVKSHIQKFNKS